MNLEKFNETLESAIKANDPSALFRAPSQTSNSDRISLLRIQAAVRSRKDGFKYIETGSHVGGTLTPYLLDPLCASIISIDPRPEEQPDERFRSFRYRGNSTRRMIDGLAEVVSPEALKRLRTFDLDASRVPKEEMPSDADLLMVDGEHTNYAAFSDAISLLPYMSSNGTICFHDSILILSAIRNVHTMLDRIEDVRCFYLPDQVAVLARGSSIPSMTAALEGVEIPLSLVIEKSEWVLRRAAVTAAIVAKEIPPLPVPLPT